MQIVANGIQIEVETHGPAGGDPLLLIMGLGMQLIGWPDELVDMLVQRGFRVLRHDNRDVGLSQGFDAHGVPNVMVTALRQRLRLRIDPPYRVADMAADALGVLDALGIERAHVCGASMGGMIAQHLAAKHPQRVKSLTLIMTTSGARDLQQPRAEVLSALLTRPMRADLHAYAEHSARLLRVIGSPGYPTPLDRAEKSYLRYFLDKAASSILAFEGDGRVVRYEGNWSMYVKLRPPPGPTAEPRPKAAPKPRETTPSAPKKGGRLSYKD